MFVKRFLVLSALLLAAVAAPRSSSANVLYATGFENPPFLVGLPLVGQDGWIAPPVLSPNAGPRESLF